MELERLKNTAEIASNIAVVLVAVAVLSFAIAYFWTRTDGVKFAMRP